MTVGTDTLRAFERARWARQVKVLQAWLATLGDVTPRGDALRCVFAGSRVADAAAAQMRFDLERDLQRLRTAIDGKTPSAVDAAREYDSPEAFARDEAVHTLDNAAVFLGKAAAAGELVACGGEVVRAQRWIQRLRWELVDTGVDAALPLGLSADAVAVAVGTEVCGVQALAVGVQTELEALRGRLCGVVRSGP